MLAAMSDTTAAAPAGPAALPLFYRQPQPLEPKRHAALRLAAGGNFGFAATTNAVALLGAEFPQASRHYPIVFTAGANALPAAVLGVKNEQNLFVDATGRWEPGAYIPAYVRRYPFIFLEQPGGDRLTLCVDEASELVKAAAGRPLFDGEQPSAATKQALELCTQFQRDAQATRAFVQAAEAKGILVERRADVALERGGKMALAGFRVIDETRFSALDDATFLEWRKNGWIGLVYCHLLSTAAWSGLVDRAAKRVLEA